MTEFPRPHPRCLRVVGNAWFGRRFPPKVGWSFPRGACTSGVMKQRILIIEDQAPMRRNIALLLEMEGYEVATSPNGKDGLEKLKSFKPQLVVCDVMMPEMDGHAVIQA